MNLEILFLKQKKEEVLKRVYKNVVNLYNTLLAIYFNNYNSITDEEKKMMDKKMVLVIYFLKAPNMMNGTKKMKKKVKHSRKKPLGKE